MRLPSALPPRCVGDPDGEIVGERGVTKPAPAHKRSKKGWFKRLSTQSGWRRRPRGKSCGQSEPRPAEGMASAAEREAGGGACGGAAANSASSMKAPSADSTRVEAHPRIETAPGLLAARGGAPFCTQPQQQQHRRHGKPGQANKAKAGREQIRQTEQRHQDSTGQSKPT